MREYVGLLLIVSVSFRKGTFGALKEKEELLASMHAASDQNSIDDTSVPQIVEGGSMLAQGSMYNRCDISHSVDGLCALVCVCAGDVMMFRVAVLAAALAACATAQNVSCPSPQAGNIYGYSATLLNGANYPFSSLAGKVVLVVNVASFDNYTNVNCTAARVCVLLLEDGCLQCVWRGTMGRWRGRAGAGPSFLSGGAPLLPFLSDCWAPLRGHAAAV